MTAADVDELIQDLGPSNSLEAFSIMKTSAPSLHVRYRASEAHATAPLGTL
jgi:hypothetical protein